MSTAEIGVDDYLDFVEREYLADYIVGGGASVKLLCPADDTVRERLAAGFPGLGGSTGYAYAEVDAATTRIHLIDQVFTAVARQIDWVGLAEAVVRSALDQAGFPAPGETGRIDLAVIARHHDVDAAELYRSVRRSLERLVLRDAEMSHEFRVAMLRLCQERLGRSDVTPAERETVIGWLYGERMPAADLRGVGLNTKVNRYNARPLLLSLTRWLRVAGRAGLVLRLDLDRLAVTRRPPVGLRDGFYYAKGATLDAYELVRQLIDAIDEIAGLFVAVQVPPVLVHDESRGLPSYSALQLRVADEVHDLRRQNPYAALVRLGAESAEVSR
jgi:hypothetical protein